MQQKKKENEYQIKISDDLILTIKFWIEIESNKGINILAFFDILHTNKYFRPFLSCLGTAGVIISEN